ncbi:MAG TPA: YppG family protein [Bacillales bacterium]|nr:YppG family protein [Bacillales bacterium]
MLFGNQRNHFNDGYPGQMMQRIPYHSMWHTGFDRNHPYPYPAPPQNYKWQSYQPQTPYYQGGIQPVNQGFSQNYMQQQSYLPQAYPQKDSQFLFQNPLQPQEEIYPNQIPQMGGYVNMNPYPKPNMMAKQSGGMQSFMNSFKSQDGSVDFSKMVNTAGQMMNAVNQVSSLVKGLGGIFKA